MVVFFFNEEIVSHSLASIEQSHTANTTLRTFEGLPQVTIYRPRFPMSTPSSYKALQTRKIFDFISTKLCTYKHLWREKGLNAGKYM